MAGYIPSGRLSAITCGEQRIEIQTEYAQHPRPRVATTITVAGKVVHKIQKNWEKVIACIEEMHQAEELINSQHDEVALLVKEHGDIILQHTQESSPADSRDRLLREAEQITAVRKAFLMTADGSIHTGGRVSQRTKTLGGAIVNIVDLLRGIAAVTSLGDWEDCVLAVDSEHLLLVPFAGGYLAALVSRDVKKKEILTELHQLVDK
jgi:hypothetical protein